MGTVCVNIVVMFDAGLAPTNTSIFVWDDGERIDEIHAAAPPFMGGEEVMRECMIRAAERLVATGIWQ